MLPGLLEDQEPNVFVAFWWHISVFYISIVILLVISGMHRTGAQHMQRKARHVATT